MSKVVLTDARTDPRPASPAGLAALVRARGLSPWGILVTRCEVVLAGLFLFAAYNKLKPPNGPQLFSDAIHAFKLGLPGWSLRLSTGITPWVEVVAGLCLLLGAWSRAAAAVLGALLVVFIGLITSVLARGLNTECGCFGKLSPFCPEKISTCNIYQNLILLAMALVIAFTARHRLVSTPPAA